MSQRKICAILVCCGLIWASAAYSQNQNPPNQAPPSPQSPRTPANPSPRESTSPTSRTNQTDTKSTSNTGDSFVSKAIEINSAEVELGKLAAKKAQNTRVKTFANMMVKDHSAALTKLQKLHSGGKVAMSAEHKDLQTKLDGLSGAQFDREYMDAMVMGHRAAVTLFEQETGSTGHASATSDAARDLLPTIKHHLEEAQDIQKSLTQAATK